MSNLENELYNKELTPEQQEKLKKLAKSVRLRSAGFGFKFGLLFFLTNIIISFISTAYVESNIFAFVVGIINGVFLFKMVKDHMIKEKEEIDQKVKEILDQKGTP